MGKKHRRVDNRKDDEFSISLKKSGRSNSRKIWKIMGSDLFEFPPEPYLVKGDFKTYEEASEYLATMEQSDHQSYQITFDVERA